MLGISKDDENSIASLEQHNGEKYEISELVAIAYIDRARGELITDNYKPNISKQCIRSL